jgi:hypothetical protein
MNFVDLILTVCLVASPGECRVEHLHFESRGSLVQCIVLAPSEIARWSEDHPKLKVVRWKCAYPDKGRAL